MMASAQLLPPPEIGAVDTEYLGTAGSAIGSDAPAMNWSQAVRASVWMRAWEGFRRYRPLLGAA